MKVFVSSEDIDSRFVKSMIEELRCHSFVVSHSPRKNNDTHWGNWYEQGLDEELKQVEIFIAVITKSWELSTWMAHEINAAYQLLNDGKIKKVFFWNPENIEVKSLGMIDYLKNELPEDRHKVLEVLK